MKKDVNPPRRAVQFLRWFCDPDLNFINLTVAHSLRRGKEIGIRKVIGGQRRQLIGQFLGESFMLCFLAFVGAMLIVQLVLPFFNELVNKRLSFSYLLDIKLVAGYMVLFLFIHFYFLYGYVRADDVVDPAPYQRNRHP